jgi:hypothetical protein
VGRTPWALRPRLARGLKGPVTHDAAPSPGRRLQDGGYWLRHASNWSLRGRDRCFRLQAPRRATCLLSTSGLALPEERKGREERAWRRAPRFLWGEVAVPPEMNATPVRPSRRALSTRSWYSGALARTIEADDHVWRP